MRRTLLMLEFIKWNILVTTLELVKSHTLLSVHWCQIFQKRNVWFSEGVSFFLKRNICIKSGHQFIEIRNSGQWNNVLLFLKLRTKKPKLQAETRGIFTSLYKCSEILTQFTISKKYMQKGRMYFCLKQCLGHSSSFLQFSPLLFIVSYFMKSKPRGLTMWLLERSTWFTPNLVLSVVKKIVLLYSLLICFAGNYWLMLI